MMTVADVLGTAPVQRGTPEVLAGASGLGAQVRWIHVSDVPRVAELLDGGELLLTTGGFLSQDDTAAVAELDRLVASGAVGVVLELGPPPGPAVVARAEHHGLPLVVLRAPVRFVEITEHVHRSLVSSQLAQVSFAADVHATFTTLGLQRADRPTILEAAASLLGGPVVLEDQRRRVLGSASPGTDAAQLLADWERRSRLATWRAGTDAGGPEGWLTTTVGVQGRVWARLVAPRPDSPERTAVVLERAAQALELGRMIERDEAATVLRLHGSLLSDLLSGRPAEEREAVARLRATGMTPTGTYRGLAVARGTEGGVLDTVEQVRRTLDEARLAGLVAVLDDAHVGVLVPGSADALDRLHPVAARSQLTVAAGHEVHRVTEVAGSLRSARSLAGVAHDLLEGHHGVVQHADVRLQGLLARLGDSVALAEFVEAELGEVLAHDARHGSDLLGLLRAYLAAGGNVTTLARTTHRNRSSLYPALERLESVVGHPLAPVASRTSLTVALLAHDLDDTRRLTPVR